MNEERQYAILLNGQRLEAPGPTITVIQLRLLARIPAGHGIIVEGVGDQPDRLVSDTDTIDLSESCPSVFSKPPTAFGSPPDEHA
ncbi:multiubiquitin domain-containing protein [Bradyrhizobium quebecense]|uniref:Multiubiquitin domain-containing protein n=1 Tax=Bradyrhizobium quebecense TaxID=2748629 RepID=A0A974AAU6_9BRAD|nr:multiubiquitin domain-containing protein [Bradyrhizobium quebecense]UGA42177.1 multiubiquitin domain-containing protein [Bradyrhizobium quebecense]